MNTKHELAMQRAKEQGSLSVRPRHQSGGGERRPSKMSGFRRVNQWYAPGHDDQIISISAWMRRGLFMISALELADAPDGGGDVIEQWHVSMSKRNHANDIASKRPTDEECRQALACLGLTGAEEDNHHPGVARHFWMPVDPARRVDCECKTDETTHVAPDGYRWTSPINDCSGCAYRELMREQNVSAPCPIHDTDGAKK